MKKNKEKELGQINTPSRLVEQMLLFGNYEGPEILRKHVLDNSCGDGQFLSSIVRKYIWEALYQCQHPDDIAKELSEYIHGIEIDEELHDACVERLNSIAEQFGLEGITWDIVLGNTLLVDKFDGKMDYVFGNPPYVRVHNVKGGDDYEILKSFKFSEDGSSDLYLAFYECGLRELNDNGTLVYITPSSWISSASGKNMRDYIIETKSLRAVVDFGHEQLFDNAQTYSMVAAFHKKMNADSLSYFTYDNQVFTPVSSLTYSDIVVDGKFVFAPKNHINTLNEIEKTPCTEVRVKNGLATLLDKVFIDELPEDFPTDFSIPVLKASTGKWGKCLFPYDVYMDGTIKPIPLEDIETYHPELYNYIMLHEEELKNRTYDKGSNWWEIGRSQGLSDTFKDKIAINNLIKKPGEIKIESVPSGSHVYSGFYILTSLPLKTIKKALDSESFFEYVKMLKKYKSGEYYTFSSKDVEKFLNYWITKYGDK